MKLSRLLVILLAVACVGAVQAQPKTPAAKTPADLAAEEFFKLRDDKEAKLGPARSQKVNAAGIAFITQYPTYGKINDVIRSLVGFGSTMRGKDPAKPDKNLAAMREAWNASLRFDIVTQRTNSALNEDAQVAIAALDAALAGVEARESFTRDTLDAYRDKIDTLSQMPGASRFLLEQERGYLDLIKQARANAVEPYLNKLLEHPDKAVAAMAQDELNLIELGKAPYELKFTALDGKECDLAALRGKAVALVFFTTGNSGSVKVLETATDVYSDYRKKGFELVAVSFDKQADKEKLEKFVKDKKLNVPVYFDGKDSKNEWANKLSVRRVPAIVLIDTKGMLVTNTLRADRLEFEVKRLLNIDQPKPGKK